VLQQAISLQARPSDTNDSGLKSSFLYHRTEAVVISDNTEYSVFGNVQWFTDLILGFAFLIHLKFSGAK